MKITVAKYIAKLLVEKGIKDVFSVVGGGAMHLNDAFGNQDGLHVLYNHHEQACAMAAEGYARVNPNPAVVCVTTGPGGTNAITGVLCAWQDNIPMLVISGQVRYDTTVESTGLKLIQFGEQEHYIISTIKDMTKYSVMLKDTKKVRYHIEKALYIAMHGRKGPCWIDIPLDIQGATIESDDQEGFVPYEDNLSGFSKERIINMLESAKKPVVLAGSGVRSIGIYDKFYKFVHKLGIPVIAATSNADILPTNDELYFGNFGVFGGRAGNFIVQNTDCMLVLGCRLSFKQIGFNYEQFAPFAKKIVVDADVNELKKKTCKIDMPICADLNDFFDDVQNLSFKLSINNDWIEYCKLLKSKFPIYQEKHAVSNKVNPYYFFHKLKEYLTENAVIVAGNSCACVNLLQSGIDKLGQRLWGNVNCGTMGYDLPAAIGATVGSKKEVICVTGDGSIQMNLQELQTIVGNNLPVKIIVFNNNGYHAIVQTQTNFFGRLSGCTKASGITFPNFKLLANAYGIPYIRCETHEEVDEKLSAFLKIDGYALCEVIEDSNQPIEPKLQSKALPNGKFLTPPISDLAPFLSESEYSKYAEFDLMKWKKDIENV